jgi:hypothetical protein
MLSKLGSHVRHNVIGYIALFFALTGVAYAAGPLKAGDPAGGDLTGTYPNPRVVNLQFTDAGLPALPIATGCPLDAPGWYDNSSNGVQRVGYGRDAFGVVHLRGVAVNCNGPTSVFELPAGFRPDLPELFAGSHGFNSVANAFVRGTGQIEVFIGFQESISLSGITFRCGPSGQNGCP